MKSRPVDERAVMLEAASAAYRALEDHGRVRAAPEWHDLSVEDRMVAFELQCVWRELEEAADPQGPSGTLRAVLARIDWLEQLD